MAPNHRTIRLSSLPIGVTKDDIKKEVTLRISTQNSKSWMRNVPLIEWLMKPSMGVTSPIPALSSTESNTLGRVVQQGATSSSQPSQPDLSKMKISIATFKNDTQMATATLPTTKQYEQCLKTDTNSSSEWVFDGHFKGLTILNSPEDAEIE